MIRHHKIFVSYRSISTRCFSAQCAVAGISTAVLCFAGVSAFRTRSKALPVTAIYRAIVIEVERRRLSVGISMEKMSELMGSAERSYSKMIYADTPSGRIAQWQTLQNAIDVLFADGFRLTIDVHKGEPLTSAGARRLIQAEAARWDAASSRRHMAKLGTLSGRSRQDTECSERRRQQCAAAARARWGRTDAATKAETMARVRMAKREKSLGNRAAA